MAEEPEKLEYEDIPKGADNWDVPVNERFSWIKEEWNKLVEKIGSAAYEDTGTGPDEVPTNEDLGIPEGERALHPGEIAVETVSSSGTEQTLDRSVAAVWDVTLDDDVSITLAGYESGVLDNIVLYARQDDTGGRTITWPTEVVWPDAVAPNPVTDPNTLSIWQLDTIDGGTTVVGYLVATGVA